MKSTSSNITSSIVVTCHFCVLLAWLASDRPGGSGHGTPTPEHEVWASISSIPVPPATTIRSNADARHTGSIRQPVSRIYVPAPIPAAELQHPDDHGEEVSHSADPPATGEAAQTVSVSTAYLIVERARKDLQKIDRELRGRTPGVPEKRPITAVERLSQRIDDAYVGSNPNDSRFSYESPEGVTYYAQTHNGRTTCAMSAPVTSPSGKSNGAIPISCPELRSEWKKY
jgi:hypothetical protein